MPACHAGGRGFESRPVRQITRLNVCFYRRFFVYGLLFSLIGTVLGTTYFFLDYKEIIEKTISFGI